MKRKNQILIFILVAFISVIAILKLQPPLRNYIPIFWAFYGFVLNGALYVFYFFKINKRLTDDYPELLKQLHIGTYYVYVRINRRIKVIDTLILLGNKSLRNSVDEETRNRIRNMKLNYTLAIVAFVLFALLGLLTVFMAARSK